MWNEPHTCQIIMTSDKTIYFPMIWGRTGSFTVEDLKPDRFQEIVEIFKSHYFPYNKICQCLGFLKDEESVRSFCERLLFIMGNNSSIIAVDENSMTEEGRRKIAGVLVMRIIDKFDYQRVLSRNQLASGDAMKEYVRLRQHMHGKVDFFAKYLRDRILRYYDLCLLPEYMHKGLANQLMRCGIDVGKANGAAAVTGLFENDGIQNVAKKIGMQTLYTLNYVEWRNEERDFVFPKDFAGCCSLMDLNILPPPSPPIVSPPQILPKVEVRDKKKNKKKPK